MAYVVRGLDRHRFDVTLAVGISGGPFAGLLPPDVPVIDLGTTSGSAAIVRIARLLRSARFDVCFSMMSFNLSLVIARAVAGSRIPIVLGARNHYSLSLPLEARAARLKMLAVRCLYRHANLVIGVSQGVCQDLADNFGVPTPKTLAIHNPIDLDLIRQCAGEDNDDPWLAQRDRIPVVIAVGKLMPAKGYGDLLEAFRQVRSQLQARLLILGEGPQRGRIEALISRLGLDDDVRLLGFQPNPYAYLSRATAFAHAAHWEGFPNVLLEAMACGLPVIATDCPSGPAEIVQDGENGLLLPVHDPHAFGDAMFRVLTDDCLRRRLGAAAARRAESFAAPRIVEAYAQAFERVVQAAESRP